MTIVRTARRLGAVLVLLGSAAATPAQAQPAPRPAVDAALLDDLAAASRILADLGVLDGFGHVTLRHPNDPNRFLMSRSLAPALVTPDDIMEFDLDGNAIDARGRAVFLERFIHGEIYRARPDVNAVVHSHSPGVIRPAPWKTAALTPRSGRVAAGPPPSVATRWRPSVERAA